MNGRVPVFGLLLVAGCGGNDGPELINVRGVVTMDGQPLANAAIAFLPAGEGVGGTSPSYGTTDEDGEYSLQYSISRDGVLPGKYRVTISTYQQEDDDEGVAGRAETVPAQYNQNTELEVDVAADGGPYDFALESTGEIIQPLSDDEDGPDEDEF